MANFNETFDWVVVGSGAGSLASAIVMQHAGKTVGIFEKSEYVGGTTAKSGGVIWVPNNRFMKEAGDADSAEAAITYLDAVVEDSADTPGTSHEKRLAYVTQAPLMIEFLTDQGLRFERASTFWPDYYDELPGGCKTSRGVVAQLFDAKALGEWASKLRPGFLPVPARLEEAMKLPYFKQSWAGRLTFLRVAVRTVVAKLTGKKMVSAGAALQGRMLLAALKAGATIHLRSPVSDLITEDGRVVGVETVKDGQPWRVGATLGVLVNAGGFARNQEMRDRYMPGTQAAWSQTAEGDTGEMHGVMERAGATLAQMDEMVGCQTTPAPGWEAGGAMPPAQSLTGKPHAILVDQSGVRYLNEGGSYELYCEMMLKRNHKVKAVPSWAIFDTDFIGKYALAGTFPGSSKPESWISGGFLKKAATIEDLAAQTEIEPAVLRGTVDRWNGFVSQGRDDDFHRGERSYDEWLGDPCQASNKSLGKIEKGPFYAVPVLPGDVGTNGGVVVDANGRVTAADGRPIAGLYATGVSTASVMGRVYPAAGASVGASLVFGYIAAKHAAGLNW